MRKGVWQRADVAQLVERVLGKDEVSGSIPLIGSRDSQNVIERPRAALAAISGRVPQKVPRLRSYGKGKV